MPGHTGWPSRGTLERMSTIFAIVGAVVETLAPDGTMAKVRARTIMDILITLLAALLAVVLIVGYQVLGRWGHRFLSDD